VALPAKEKIMDQPETLLENRVLALEARVVALEKSVADFPQKSQQAKSFARDVSDSHLNFRMELLSMIEDHIEVLKLVHTMVGPTDRSKNKMVLSYIRRAESKLGQFQLRFTQLDETHKRLQNGAPPKPAAQPPKLRGLRRVSLLKSTALNQLLRSVSWSNR
jgi:hypothetical protein